MTSLSTDFKSVASAVSPLRREEIAVRSALDYANRAPLSQASRRRQGNGEQGTGNGELFNIQPFNFSTFLVPASVFRAEDQLRHCGAETIKIECGHGDLARLKPRPVAAEAAVGEIVHEVADAAIGRREREDA